MFIVAAALGDDSKKNSNELQSAASEKKEDYKKARVKQLREKKMFSYASELTFLTENKCVVSAEVMRKIELKLTHGVAEFISGETQLNCKSNGCV